MNALKKHIALNTRIAQSIWGPLQKPAAIALKGLLQYFRFSIGHGDLQYLEKGWYVTHAGLLRLAHRRRCVGIHVQPVNRFCNPESRHWVFRATVQKSPDSSTFVGYGDADPSNVSLLVRGAEMRVAETRAVNRALRKAYGIGLCSVEELGWTSKVPAAQSVRNGSSAAGANGNGHSAPPRLRDRLVEATISQIEAGQFPPHSGIRFPQNGCVSCAQLGLCLGDQQLVASKLIRRPGASDLDWLDQLDD